MLGSLASLKMGDLTLNCPLCCNKTFNSKESLLEHLSNVALNLYCPVCNKNVTSLELMVEHLSLDNCAPNVSVQTIIFEGDNNEFKSEESRSLAYKAINNDTSSNEITDSNYTQIQNMQLVDSTDVNKLQIDLMKCLQTQELKFLKEDGENRYIIVTEDHTSLSEEGIVTKQNKDGTISVTTLKDIKLESEALAEPPKEESVVQEYSCSTCQVSFTSVYDHINNYHTDQDVVVEGALGDSESETLPSEYEAMENEEVSNEKQTSRRVITDTGNIVEAPLVLKTSNQIPQTQQASTTNVLQVKTKELTTEKPGRGAKRYVQIDKLCDSVITDLKQPDRKTGPCHKVVVAPSVVLPDGENMKVYHCTSCNIYASQLSDFKTQPCKPAKYSCTHCPVTYDNSKSLCAHMKVHKAKTENMITEAPETFECEICCTVFPTNKSLKLHKRMHDPIKSRPMEPPRESSREGARHRCAVCERMIPDDYRAVHSASHDADKMLICAICNKKFSSPEYLEMHMNVHNMDKAPHNKSDKSLPYSCIYCERKFARPHEKVKHERIHTGERPHECEICGKSFRVSYCLTLHMRTHTGARPYACPHCDKRFKAHSVYNHHLLTHSEVRAYKCPFCPKAFKTSVQLAGHKNSHTKPFSCTQCNRPFASLYAVRIHTETHSRQNNLKFRCSLCGASYARAFALKDHVKQVHKQDIDNLDPLTVQDDWMVKSTTDTDKDLTQEITELEMPSDEFIVPN